MSERDDDAVPATDEGRELVLGLGQPAGGDGGPLRLERVRLGLRERVELRGAVERDRTEALLLGDATRLVGLPDDVGWAADGRDEVGRDIGDQRLAVLVRAEVGLDEIGPPLGRGIDDRMVRGMQRALRERGEGADLLDLVAEELDAERLATGRGKDVDDPAADGELTTLVDAVDALVAGERERLRQPVDPRLVADTELERGGPLGERREPLGEGGDGCAHEPARRRARRARGSARRRGAAAGRDRTRSVTPLLGRKATRVASPNQDAPSAASRASASSGSSTSSPRPSSSWSAARTSGSTGSETRARAGSVRANASKRSWRRSSSTKAASGA